MDFGFVTQGKFELLQHPLVIEPEDVAKSITYLYILYLNWCK